MHTRQQVEGGSLQSDIVQDERARTRASWSSQTAAGEGAKPAPPKEVTIAHNGKDVVSLLSILQVDGFRCLGYGGMR